MRRSAIAVAFWFAIAATGSLASDDVPVVAAASDLQFVLPEIAEQFSAETGWRVRLSFGSSGNFHRQILEGGPFALFLSADEAYVLDLAERGLTVDSGVVYAVGRIALFVPKGSPLVPDGSLRDLGAKLDRGAVGKFAIANPDHAPYGRAARQALVNAGLWDRLRKHLVLGENVSQAAQFAASGTIEGGIIAFSLARSPRLANLGTYALIPAEMHAPLRQRMVLIRPPNPIAEAFYAYVQSPSARAQFEKFGFTLQGRP